MTDGHYLCYKCCHRSETKPLEDDMETGDWRTITELTPYIGLDGKPVRCSDCDHLRDLISQGKASMMPAKCYPSGGLPCAFMGEEKTNA